MKLGFLYAGQGSQHPGMGADLYEAFPALRAVIDQAAERVDFDLKEVSFTDAGGVLNQTRYTQPCMVAFAAGLTAVLREQGVVPSAAAGLSLGEYSALHAAGVFDAVTAVELVAFRGKAMEEAAAGRPSAMMAVLGLEREPLQAACDAASALGCVVIANYNSPGQLVLGGESHHAGLGVPGLIQDAVRVLKADLLQVEIHLRTVVNGTEGGIGVVQVRTHAGVLAALSGVQKAELHCAVLHSFMIWSICSRTVESFRTSPAPAPQKNRPFSQSPRRAAMRAREMQ